MNLNFRPLRADEIDLRVGTVKLKNPKDRDSEVVGYSLLLYKDARVDMNLLDEVVGPLNWKRSHSRENANCVVSIWDDSKREWVSKEDTGTESNTEKEKGLASDSFKRACINWGIGRELYTGPFVWINSNNKFAKYSVSEIDYDDNRNICYLVIVDADGKTAFSFGKKGRKVTSKPLNEGDKANAEESLAQDSINSMIKKIESCATSSEVAKVWNENKDLQSESWFVSKIKERGEKCKKAEEDEAKKKGDTK